jgi:anti-sigma regulatory factor (Ser/Thr protein kinase)
VYLRWPLVSILELGPFPEAPSRARRHTKDVLGTWGAPRALVPDAEMLCSELVTNALRASLSLTPPLPFGLRLLANAQRLVIEAWDCHPADPVRRSAADQEDEAESGRGLAIVEGLANRWGSRRLSENVKTVWAELLWPDAG